MGGNDLDSSLEEVIEVDDSFTEDEAFDNEVEALLKSSSYGEAKHHHVEGRPPSGSTVARLGSARPGSARPGSARPGSARPGNARPGAMRHGQASVGNNGNTREYYHTTYDESEHKHMHQTKWEEQREVYQQPRERSYDEDEDNFDSENIAEEIDSEVGEIDSEEDNYEDDYDEDVYDEDVSSHIKQALKHSPKTSIKEKRSPAKEKNSPKTIQAGTVEETGNNKLTRQQNKGEIVKEEEDEEPCYVDDDMFQPSASQHTAMAVKAKTRAKAASAAKINAAHAKAKTNVKNPAEQATAAAAKAKDRVAIAKAKAAKAAKAAIVKPAVDATTNVPTRPHSASTSKLSKRPDASASVRPTSAINKERVSNASSFNRLKQQNNLLKQEIARLKSNIQGPSLRVNTNLETDGRTITSTGINHNVVGMSTLKFQQRRASGGSALFQSVMNTQERQMWMHNINGKKKPSKAISKQRTYELREAMWDNRTMAGDTTGSTANKFPFFNQVAAAAKLKQQCKVSSKSSRSKTVPVQSREQIKQVYLDSAALKVRNAGPGKKQKKMKTKSKKGGKNGSKVSASIITRLARFEQDYAAAFTPESDKQSITENNSRNVIVDWGGTELFQQSARRLSDAFEESSQMEALLSAIDDPSTIRTAFDSGCAQLKVLWGDLYIRESECTAFQELYMKHCTTGNFAHLLSQVTRLTNLRNKLLQTFDIIKRREALVASLAKVLDPVCTGRENKPQSPKQVIVSADNMAELRTLNEGLVLTIHELEQETGHPFILHGLKYSQKIRYDLVLP